MPDFSIDYTAKDYAGFRRMMLDAKRELLPEWESESPNDFGVVLIEVFAYGLDILSFYGDRIANEAFLSTATDRASIVDMARMLDYRPTGTTAATVDIEFTSSSSVTVPAGTVVSTQTLSAVSSGEPPVFFETLEDTVVDGTVAIGAVEGTTVSETVGESSGRIDQEFLLNQYPVIDRSVRIFVDEGIGPTEWTYFDRLIEAGSNRNAFTTSEDSRGVITVLFGDNVNGRVPAIGASIVAEYRVGVGERGNVAANTLTELQSDVLEVTERITQVTNPLPATGGASQESTDSIRKSAPQTLRALYRAVSLRDYEDITVGIPGIAKAKAVQPGYQTVVVYVAPFGIGTAASVEKKAEVTDFLEARKMSNITVIVDDPVFVPIDITITVRVKEEFNRAQVEEQAKLAVVDLLRFENVDFGYFFAQSRVYEAAAKVPGVDSADLTVLDRDAGTGVGNIQLASLEIPVVGTVTVTATGGILGT